MFFLHELDLGLALALWGSAVKKEEPPKKEPAGQESSEEESLRFERDDDGFDLDLDA